MFSNKSRRVAKMKKRLKSSINEVLNRIDKQLDTKK